MSGLIVALSTATLQGCAWWQAATFSGAPESGKALKRVELSLVTYEAAALDGQFDSSGVVGTLWEKDKDVRAACPDGKTRPKAVSFLPVLVPAVGKLLFDLALDEQQRSVEALKAAAAPAPYGARVILPADQLRKATCAVLVRWARDDPDDSPGFVAVVRFENPSIEGMAAKPTDEVRLLRPVYVRARSAVAVTASGQLGSDAAITVAFGAVVKAVGRLPASAGSLPTLLAVGEGSSTVKGVPIGASAKHQCVIEACAPTDLFAFPPGGTQTSFAMTVAEVGNVGFNVDVAVAELKALKAALGPVVTESLKDLYK